MQREDVQQRKVQSFRDLVVWQRSLQLCVAVYGLAGGFPREELYGLTSQIRRAAVSINSNIAEGHGRGTPKQLLQFLGVARGSCFEVQAQLLIAGELGYCIPESLTRCEGLCNEVGRMLFATMKSLRAKHNIDAEP
jgi:four helix bundle protein